MANPFQSRDQADDPLALFDAEAESAPEFVQTEEPSALFPVIPGTESKSVRLKVDSPRLSAGGSLVEHDIVLRTPPSAENLAAQVAELRAVHRDVSVEVLGPPPPAGSVSFDHVCAVKGLGFVEGVALIQATCQGVMAAGPGAGVPELHGLFLTASGEVVLHGPPTGEPPARELARLLHQLVAPDLMPPAGRLFVGRWINNEAGGLTELTSEIAYFARPNGAELLVALHARCNGQSGPKPIAVPHRRRPAPAPKPSVEPRPRGSRLRESILDHKPEITAVLVVIVAAMTTAIATVLWPSNSTKARQLAASAQTQTADGATSPEAAPPTEPTPPRATSGEKARNNRAPAPVNRGRNDVPPVGRRTGANQPPTVPNQLPDAANGGPPTAGSLSPLATTALPDLRIYSSADVGVEPPKLRSLDILEQLLTGFPIRKNSVELVINERGDVQQARMLDAPQRMPDIMLLSRIKELHFDPAVRNGVPVRFRQILSWNVTP